MTPRPTPRAGSALGVVEIVRGWSLTVGRVRELVAAGVLRPCNETEVLADLVFDWSQVLDALEPASADPLASLELATVVDLEAELEHRETARELDVALRVLQPRTRRAIVAAIVEGHTYREIGDELGITHERVRQIVERGLEDLAHAYRRVLAGRAPMTPAQELDASRAAERAARLEAERVRRDKRAVLLARIAALDRAVAHAVVQRAVATPKPERVAPAPTALPPVNHTPPTRRSRRDRAPARSQEPVGRTHGFPYSLRELLCGERFAGARRLFVVAAHSWPWTPHTPADLMTFEPEHAHVVGEIAELRQHAVPPRDAAEALERLNVLRDPRAT